MRKLRLYTLRHPLVWISILIAGINQLVQQYMGIIIPYVHSYLDALLCMPVVLGVSTQIIQWLHPAGRYYFLSKYHILIAVIFFSIVFEGIFPVYFPNAFTADWLDVVMYIIGAFLFYVLVSKKAEKKWDEITGGE